MSKTILLADDSLTIQKVVELTFADTPYNVVSVSSGDELLDKIPEVKPELIICDIIMPGRDGYDVCQDIKSSPDTLHLPVILLSGTFEPLDRDRALAVGCSEILTKPFEARKLIDAVERLLRRRDEGEARSAADAGARDAETGPVAPAGARGRDFGTRIAPPTDDAGAPDADDSSFPGEEIGEGLDFTETGFAEMEAAGASAADRPTAEAAGGLDFEIGDGSDIDPFADLDEEPAREGDDDLTDAFGMHDEPFAEAVEEIDEAAAEGAVFGAPQRLAEDIALGVGGPADVTEDDTSFDDEDEGFAPPDGPAFAAVGGGALDDSGFTLRSAEEAFGPGPGPITDADTAPLPPLAAAAGQSEEAPESERAEPAARLSDEDVDRIARRLLELADEKIEQIAWEVIPDVAEIVVRERIRKLEAELETEN